MQDVKGSLQEPLVPQEEPPPQLLTFSHNSGQFLSKEADDDDYGASTNNWEWMWREVKEQLYIACPMSTVSILQYSILVVSDMFVGHLGERELASGSIALTFASMTGTTTLMGMASALETLCGQAYGAKQYHLLGIYLQRALFVLYLVCIPMSILWWFISPLLKLLGQDPVLSEMAEQYTRLLIPMLFASGTFQAIVRFLQTQNGVHIMPVFSIATMIFHVPLLWFLISKLGIGFRGAAIAISISNWANVLLFVLYVKFSPTCSKTWTSFSREAFNDIPAYFKLAIPSAIMICFEFWAIQSLVLISGLLPNPKLETSTLAICIITLYLLYLIPNGISSAVSTRVSNALGAGRPGAAKAAVRVAVALGLTVSVLMAAILLACQDIWSWAFTSEQEVADYVRECIPFIATLNILNSIQVVISGVARGCGWQSSAAVVNLVAYYVVGLPAAVVLAFVYDYKVKGLCMGLFFGVFTHTFTLVLLTLHTDWEKQAKIAFHRVYRSASATFPITSEKNVSTIQDSRGCNKSANLTSKLLI